jgi:hypothetical protein
VELALKLGTANIKQKFKLKNYGGQRQAGALKVRVTA